MLTDMQKQMKIKWSQDSRKSKSHKMGSLHREYFKQLSDTADVPNALPVFSAISFELNVTKTQDPLWFRSYRYTIIDEKRFIKIKTDEI